MANIQDVLNMVQNTATNTQNSSPTATVSGTETQTSSSTVTTENQVSSNTTSNVTAVDTAATPATSQTTGDSSTSTTVSTPVSTTASGTTPITAITSASGVGAALSDELYNSSASFNEYASKSGYTIQSLNGSTYVNNTIVDWAKLGLNLGADGNLTGTKAQYDELLNLVRNSGYYTGETFMEFAVNAGYKVARSYDGKYVLINGIPVDPEQYDSMTKLNGNWVGKTESYNAMIAEAMSPTKADPDYLASTEFADYARAKGFYITKNNSGLSVNVNGMLVRLEYYPGLKVVNGKVVGDEATYRQILQDSYIYSRDDMITYYNKKGYQTKYDANGYITISKDGQQWFPLHAVYWQNTEGAMRMVNNQWYASPEVFDAAAEEAFNRSSYSLDEFAKILGYSTSRSTSGNIVIGGKEIPGTNVTDIYGKGTAAYYSDLMLIGGKYVGSETLYRKILTDLQDRSTQSFNDYAGGTVSVLNNKVYVNGELIDLSGTSLQIVNGEVYGTEADYKAISDKIEEGYTYKSPYQSQIDEALAEIQQFEAYRTPQETLDQINTLMESAKEKFNYDPTQDSSLKTAQKEAERIVREGAGSKGLLYSSGTISTAARRAGELIPTYEQQAYNRWADQKNREANLLNTIMEWDNMAAQRNIDQLNLMKTKFDTVMDMDTQSFERFKVILNQRNEDRKYALEVEKLNIEEQQAALESAWKRVESLGYVDEQASVVLGVPVGTKASWAQQAALEHEYALQELATQNDYAIAQQKSQAAIERDLIAYRTYEEECAQIRNLNRTYGMEYSLQQQQFQNDLYIARNY